MDEPSRKNVKRAKAHAPTKRLNVDVPLSVYRRVNTACSATRRQMLAEPGDWIEAYIIGSWKVRSEVAGTAPPLMRVLPLRDFLLK